MPNMAAEIETKARYYQHIALNRRVSTTSYIIVPAHRRNKARKKLRFRSGTEFIARTRSTGGNYSRPTLEHRAVQRLASVCDADFDLPQHHHDLLWLVPLDRHDQLFL
jgi:hypothetical protein